MLDRLILHASKDPGLGVSFFVPSSVPPGAVANPQCFRDQLERPMRSTALCHREADPAMIGGAHYFFGQHQETITSATFYSVDLR